MPSFEPKFIKCPLCPTSFSLGSEGIQQLCQHTRGKHKIVVSGLDLVISYVKVISPNCENKANSCFTPSGVQPVSEVD